MNILSIDFSTSSTGYAYFRDGVLFESGLIKPKLTKEYQDNKFLYKSKIIAAELKAKFDKVDVVVIEDLRVINNQATLKKLAMGIGVVVQTFDPSPVVFYGPSEWRKEFFKGRLKRAEAKQAAIDFVENLYNKEVQDDEAEAILLGLAHQIKEDNK